MDMYNPAASPPRLPLPFHSRFLPSLPLSPGNRNVSLPSPVRTTWAAVRHTAAAVVSHQMAAIASGGRFTNFGARHLFRPLRGRAAVPPRMNPAGPP
jgi:hypothetical protein